MPGRIDDGFPTTLTLSLNPNVKFWEKSITPPSLQGGGANDTTTMRNTRVRTKAPRKLLDVGDVAFTAAYDPAVYEDALDMMQINQEAWINWPDGDALVVWGWLDTVEFGELTTEGEQPDSDWTFIVSNQDDDGDEILPHYTADSGDDYS
jgi:hypothetical protein